MAKEFDIYLRKNLTECDVLVYSIVYRDGLTVTDRLILEAALKSYTLQKFAAVQMKSELTAHIDDMLKLCMEKLDMETELDARAELMTHGMLAPDGSSIVLGTSTVETLERAMIEAENKLVLTVQPLETQTFKSMGRICAPTDLKTYLSSTFKRGFIQTNAVLDVKVDIEQISQTDYIDVNSGTVPGTTLESLCYLFTFNASAAVRMAAIVLGTKISHSLGKWYNGLALAPDLKGIDAQKFIVAETITSILQEVIWTLMKVLYPDNADVTVHASDLNASMKRYRLLNEMDDLTLAELDDMTLGELDYVWLTD